MAKPSFIETDLEKWLKSFRFKTSSRTRFGETDAFGHINNVSYFTYFEQARIDYFENLEIFEQLNIRKSLLAEPNDNIVVTANLECHYLSELLYGQNIDTYVRTARLGNSSFDLEYAIVDDKNNLIAVGQGSIVYINRTTKKGEPLPERVKKTIAAYENL